MKMQLAEIAQALQIESQPAWQDIIVTSVCFDSRNLEPGALFIPLVVNNDGHNYVQSAIEKGAVATLWQLNHQEQIVDLPQLLVPNSLQALQKLAKYYLNKINPQVVAITGSNGKTTTKDMTAAVLATQYNVQKTQANFNNEIGVPLTILAMEPNTEILVVELGMDHPGELTVLSELVEPDVAVITMIGEAHLEFFGTRDKIADSKMEIVTGLKEDGVLIYKGNEPLLQERVAKISQESLTFGTDEAVLVDYQAEQIKSDGVQTRFMIKNHNTPELTIPLMGEYNVANALTASAVGEYFHITGMNLQKALREFALTKNRTEWVSGKQGARILSDVYNSNPTAAKEVLKTITDLPVVGEKIVVLGDMLELGAQSSQLHASLAEVINADEISQVYLCGEMMRHLGEVLADKMPVERIHLYDVTDKELLLADLQKEIKSDDLVLVKGSHGIHLEEIVAGLAE